MCHKCLGQSGIWTSLDGQLCLVSELFKYNLEGGLRAIIGRRQKMFVTNVNIMSPTNFAGGKKLYFRVSSIECSDWNVYTVTEPASYSTSRLNTVTVTITVTVTVVSRLSPKLSLSSCPFWQLSPFGGRLMLRGLGVG